MEIIMSIFVSIASYCDELLPFTIKDCLKKAANPENIVFGVVDQNDKRADKKIKKLHDDGKIKYMYIDKHDTLGVSWARNIAFSLWDGEEYLLQIDSHMLFEDDWDLTLLEQYKKLKLLSQKPIISTYPYGFTFDKNKEPKYDKQSGKYALVLRPHVEAELKDDDAIMRFQAYHRLTSVPVLGSHLAGGFIFTSSDFIEEVPYDPFLYFHGEEQSLAIRAYTKGWDIYHPNFIPLYHLYKKINEDYKSHHWHKSIEDKRTLKSAYLKKRATQRINRLFYGDGMIGKTYGLGRVRSLDDFIAFSGINYRTKVIKPIEEFNLV
jgi:hypothetical protein